MTSTSSPPTEIHDIFMTVYSASMLFDVVRKIVLQGLTSSESYSARYYYYYFYTLGIYDPDGFGNKKLEIENVRTDT